MWSPLARADAAMLLQVDYAGATQEAISTISDPWAFFLVVLATLLGLFMGMIPGLGGVVALSLVIPLTFGMDPIVAFAVLSAVTGGTNFGGSVTSILINTPGKSGNAATLLDGYPMSRDGRAAEAIGASATASALGSFAGIIVVIISIPVMMEILGLFASPEIFWLALWGLTVVSVVVKGAVLAGLISAAFGVIFAMHGVVEVTGQVRWDYGLLFMRDGMQFIPALIGLFAVSEMIKLVREGGTIAGEDDGGGARGQDSDRNPDDRDPTQDESVANGGRKSTKWMGVKAVFVHRNIFWRSAFIGGLIGIIPGIGASAANFIAYFHAVKASPDPEMYGTGDIRGVIAPEASNDAKDGTAFIPTLAFGVPGSSSMAVLLGAFLLHGITVGPQLFQNELPIIAVIIVAFVISNFLTSAIGLLAAEQFYKVTQVDSRYLAPIILVIAFFGAYALDNNIYATFVMLFFGVLGYIMIKNEVSRIPMILGMVLGPLIENNFFRALSISQGDFTFLFRPYVTWVLIALIFVSLFLPWIQAAIRRYRGGMIDEESVTVDEEIQEELEEEPQEEDERALWPGRHRHYRFAFFGLLFVWAGYLLAEVVTYENFAEWFFPSLFIPLVMLLLGLQIFKMWRPDIWEIFLPAGSDEDSMVLLAGGESERTLYEQQKVELYMIGWATLLVAGSFYLGMGLMLPLFLFGFVYFFTRNVVHTILMTVGIVLFMYFLFIEALGMIIWTGRWDVFNPTEWIQLYF